MGLNIKNEKVWRLADELAHMAGETKTAAILHALEERKERIARSGPSGRRKTAQVLDFLENEIWSGIPRKLLGRPVTKKQRERILGYGRGGV